MIEQYDGKADSFSSKAVYALGHSETDHLVEAGTGRIVGAEALVRWRREPYGAVPLGMFIAWMETDPAMYELGNYVLRTALRETVGLFETLPEFVNNVNNVYKNDVIKL